MRWLLALLAFGLPAFAHGGHGCFRGPNGVPPPPARRLDCRCGHCAVCTPLSSRPDTRVRTMRDVEILERRGEMARVLVRVGFVTRADGPARAATVRIGLGARFAVTKATLRRKGLSLKSGRASNRGKAGLLIRPINNATVELRVYPVARGAVTWALLEGVALLPDPKRVEPRTYRAGRYFLAVGPGNRTASLDHGPAHYVADFALPLLTHQRSVLAAGNVKLRVVVGPAMPPWMHEPLDPIPPPPPPPPR